MSDDLRAAEALAALKAVEHARIEYKSAVAAPTLDVSGREVTTLFSCDNLDRVGDICPPSAFTKSIQERPDRIPHLLMHDVQGASIARVLSFAPVDRHDLPADVKAEYPDATGGMTCVSRFLKTARAEEVLEGIKEGLYGASFGYQVIRAEPRTLADGTRARYLAEVKLLEVSSVHRGMEANGATRSRLGKAYALLEEIKAGRRHSANDIDILNQMAALLVQMGATNIAFIDAAPQEESARTSLAAELIADIRSNVLGASP